MLKPKTTRFQALGLQDDERKFQLFLEGFRLLTFVKLVVGMPLILVFIPLTSQRLQYPVMYIPYLRDIWSLWVLQAV